MEVIIVQSSVEWKEFLHTLKTFRISLEVNLLIIITFIENHQGVGTWPQKTLTSIIAKYTVKERRNKILLILFPASLSLPPPPTLVNDELICANEALKQYIRRAFE